LIVNGTVRGNYPAAEYFKMKKSLIPDVLKAYHTLAEKYDIIVVEGAGSPAEINLRENDIVNMGLAELLDAPVLLAGDIDRGGVFAQLYGTAALLEENERARIRAFIINKFRGDKEILRPGLSMLYDRIAIPVAGVIPYMDVDIDDEDSLSERLTARRKTDGDDTRELDKKGRPCFAKISVIRLPRISNFTDFNALERLPGISLTYAAKPEDINGADLVIIPGTKNTMGDLKWLRQSGADIKACVGECPRYGDLRRLPDAWRIPRRPGHGRRGRDASRNGASPGKNSVCKGKGEDKSFRRVSRLFRLGKHFVYGV
jgi:adenosylcobyric acid synthase